MFTSHFLFWSTLCAWFFSCIWSLDINWDHFNLWQGHFHLSLPSQKIKFDKQITWKRQFDLSSIPHCTQTWRQQCTKPKNPQRERLLALGQTIISIHFKPLSPKMLHNVNNVNFAPWERSHIKVFLCCIGLLNLFNVKVIELPLPLH